MNDVTLFYYCAVIIKKAQPVNKLRCQNHPTLLRLNTTTITRECPRETNVTNP